MDREICFIVDIVAPHIRQYMRGRQFLLFSKRNVNTILGKIEKLVEEYRDVLPPKDFIGNLANGGIQKIM
jgi:hypothetical protein